MIATRKAPKPSPRQRPERGFYQQVSAVDLDTGREPVVARWYRSGSIERCALWSRLPDADLLRVGVARGYGYHKPSAALQDALRLSGWHLDTDIDGRGDGAIDEAITAIATACGASRVAIVRAHG